MTSSLLFFPYIFNSLALVLVWLYDDYDLDSPFYISLARIFIASRWTGLLFTLAYIRALA
jgi:hypothetical protein